MINVMKVLISWQSAHGTQIFDKMLGERSNKRLDHFKKQLHQFLFYFLVEKECWHCR